MQGVATDVNARASHRTGGADGHSVIRDLRTRLLSALIHACARLICSTLRLTAENMDQIAGSEGGVILVTWHGRTMIPVHYLRGRGYCALISLSRDGDLQNQIIRRFGFETVRGSTGRGAVRGTLALARRIKRGAVLAFTPDGPRGPTHKVQLGVIVLAERSGAPIIPIAASCSRRWQARSWDAYMVPMPFSRALLLAGDPIHVPRGLDTVAREAQAHRVEVALNTLEKVAEARAGLLDYPAVWPTA